MAKERQSPHRVFRLRSRVLSVFPFLSVVPRLVRARPVAATPNDLGLGMGSPQLGFGFAEPFFRRAERLKTRSKLLAATPLLTLHPLPKGKRPLDLGSVGRLGGQGIGDGTGKPRFRVVVGGLRDHQIVGRRR